MKCDFKEKNAYKIFFNKCLESLKGLSLFVNNAGLTLKQPLLDITDEVFDELSTVLFRTYILLMRESAFYMAKNGIEGSIINITSTRSFSAHVGDGVYGAVKAAIDRAIKSFALDVSPYHIRINNIQPGAIQRNPIDEPGADKSHLEKIKFLSKRIPLERYGTPNDIGNLVTFLASEKASYITGSTFIIDGGLSIPGLAETEDEEKSCGWGKLQL